MPTISRNDTLRLLALAAGADQRTVGDEDVALWHGVATLQRWTHAAAQRAIVEHYSAGAHRPRITPAAITDRLRDVRRQAAQTFELPQIPDDVPDHAYPAWLRTQRDLHVDELVDAWATTGTEPPAQLPATAPAPHLPGQRRIAAITRNAFHHA